MGTTTATTNKVKAERYKFNQKLTTARIVAMALKIHTIHTIETHTQTMTYTNTIE